MLFLKTEMETNHPPPPRVTEKLKSYSKLPPLNKQLLYLHLSAIVISSEIHPQSAKE